MLTYYLSRREHLFSGIVVSESWNSYLEKETPHRSSHTLKETLSEQQWVEGPKTEQADCETRNKVQTSHYIKNNYSHFRPGLCKDVFLSPTQKVSGQTLGRWEVPTDYRVQVCSAPASTEAEHSSIHTSGNHSRDWTANVV